MKIVKVPLVNGLGKTKGCENSPEEIISALEEIYSNDSGKFIDVGLLDITGFEFDRENIESAVEDIYNSAFELFKHGGKTVFLGGDHSASYPLTRAFFDYLHSDDRNIKEPCLIVFDAHPDLMPVAFGKTPSHEEWLRKLIEDKFPAENIILVGARNFDKEEKNFLVQHKIKFISMNSFLEDIEGVCDSLMEFANKKELYVSIDIDVVDPAFAPSTGYLEPGGFSSREILYILQRINKIKTLRAADIVEINALSDERHNNRTVKLGAKILSELL